MFPLDVSEIKVLIFLALRNISSNKAEEVIFADLSKISQTAKFCSVCSTRIKEIQFTYKAGIFLSSSGKVIS